MKRYILTLLFAILIPFGLKCQTSSTLQTMDLSLSRTGKISDTIVGPDKFLLNVKIGDIANTKKIYFMIDTMANASKIMNVVGTVTLVAGEYKIQHNEQNYPFSYYTATIPINIITEYQKKLFVTFYAEDKFGLTTNKIFYKF